MLVQPSLFFPEQTKLISPRELEVQPVAYSIAREFVEQYHYLHSMPLATSLQLGVFHSGELVGVMVFSHPCARHEDQKHTWELRRMVLLDCCGRNSESYVLARAVRYIRLTYPDIRRLIAYADPKQGHKGTIYRAAGWKYVGKTAGNPWHDREGKPRTNLSPGPKLKFELFINQ